MCGRCAIRLLNRPTSTSYQSRTTFSSVTVLMCEVAAFVFILFPSTTKRDSSSDVAAQLDCTHLRLSHAQKSF